MKKHVFFITAFTAAWMAAAQTPMTSSAAAYGWTESEDGLRYYESEGYYAADTWKRNDDNWYYLDSDGMMATDQMVDEYYVDEEGRRISNQWIAISNDEFWDSEDEQEFFWYYYGNDGRFLASKWLNVNGMRYHFDEEGHMQTGKTEVDNSIYYFGDDGAMKTGWFLLSSDSNDEEAWHYFESNGKMVANAYDKKIDGSYYTFIDGIMQTEWILMPDENADAATPSSAEKTFSVRDYQYYDTDGRRASGWRNIEGLSTIHTEDEVYTFYFKNGRAYAADNGISLFTIDGKRYGFDASGVMQTGLQTILTETGESVSAYFGNDGIARTGKQTIYNEDHGQNQTWFFYTEGSRKGQGYTGIRDNCIYVSGLRKEADAELRYAPADYADHAYLINASGVIQKAASSSKSSLYPELGSGYRDFKDANDQIFTVNTDGIIQK